MQSFTFAIPSGKKGTENSNSKRSTEQNSKHLRGHDPPETEASLTFIHVKFNFTSDREKGRKKNAQFVLEKNDTSFYQRPAVILNHNAENKYRNDDAKNAH